MFLPLSTDVLQFLRVRCPLLPSFQCCAQSTLGEELCLRYPHVRELVFHHSAEVRGRHIHLTLFFILRRHEIATSFRACTCLRVELQTYVRPVPSWQVNLSSMWHMVTTILLVLIEPLDNAAFLGTCNTSLVRYDVTAQDILTKPSLFSVLMCRHPSRLASLVLLSQLVPSPCTDTEDCSKTRHTVQVGPADIQQQLFFEAWVGDSGCHLLQKVVVLALRVLRPEPVAQKANKVQSHVKASTASRTRSPRHFVHSFHHHPLTAHLHFHRRMKASVTGPSSIPTVPPALWWWFITSELVGKSLPLQTC